MTTCIIIVTYNGMQWIDKCLKSIPSHYQTVIVDNNSTDGTIAFIRENHPQYTLLQQDRNLGFGQANNKGMSYALSQNADAVFLLNQDAYLFPNTIELLEQVSIVNRDYGVLSPVHMNGTGKLLDRNFSYYMSYDKSQSFYSDAFFKVLKPVYDVPFVNAAGWYLPKATLEKIGGFDPIFFHYGEDDNYCQRLRYHGFKIGVVCSSLMIHDRQKRKEKTIVPHSLEAVENQLRHIKHQVADITESNGEQVLTAKLQETRGSKLKNLLFMNKARVFYYTQLFQQLEKERLAIINSRVINKEIGSHYL
jgi:GT2 family glycosyltransferase